MGSALNLAHILSSYSREKKLMTLLQKVKVTIEVKVIPKKWGKLAETDGELKISFSKFPYKFDIFYWLGEYLSRINPLLSRQVA